MTTTTNEMITTANEILEKASACYDNKLKETLFETCDALERKAVTFEQINQKFSGYHKVTFSGSKFFNSTIAKVIISQINDDIQFAKLDKIKKELDKQLKALEKESNKQFEEATETACYKYGRCSSASLEKVEEEVDEFMNAYWKLNGFKLALIQETYANIAPAIEKVKGNKRINDMVKDMMDYTEISKKSNKNMTFEELAGLLADYLKIMYNVKLTEQQALELLNPSTKSLEKQSDRIENGAFVGAEKPIDCLKKKFVYNLFQSAIDNGFITKKWIDNANRKDEI